MITKEGSSKIVYFLVPWGRFLVLRRDHLSQIVKMHYFVKNLFVYSWAQIRQTENIVVITFNNLQHTDFCCIKGLKCNFHF